MKLCIACSAEIEEEINFCKNCGVHQTVQQKDLIISPTTTLKILCILTIIGSIFGIARGWVYELISNIGENDEYFRSWIYIITNVGTLVGAILMLERKKRGLHLYTISQSIYILTVIYTTFVYGDLHMNEFVLGVSMLFLVPSILFLILYWQNNTRMHLQ